MFSRILVPLDGSELAEAIVPDVEDIAADDNAEVVLLRVLSTRGILPERAEEERQEAEEYLMRVEQGLLEKGINARYTIRHGWDAAAEILDCAQVNNVDLIAMSTRGRSPIGPWLFGWVASRVSRSTSVPVLLIRPWKGARLRQRRRMPLLATKAAMSQPER